MREREEREERERRKLLSLNLDEDEEREEQIDSTSTGNEEKEKPSNKVVTLHSTEEQSVDEAPLDSGQLMQHVFLNSWKFDFLIPYLN